MLFSNENREMFLVGHRECGSKRMFYIVQKRYYACPAGQG
jgi:hypothetical protein